MFGDNGQATKSAHMPAYEALGLNIAHIPLLIYGPGLISQARMDDTPGGQADVLPTIAALAGTAALNTTLGSSLVTGADRPRYAFMQTKAGADPEIGLVGKEHLLLIKTNGRDARLYSLRSKTPRVDVALQHPDLVRKMSEVALGYFHLSKYIMYHNAPSRYRKD